MSSLSPVKLSNIKRHEIREIPLGPDNQRFDLVLGAINCSFSLEWNHMADVWMLSVTRRDTNKIVLNNIPLLTEVNLLQQYGYQHVPGVLMLLSSESVNHDNIGTKARLYYMWLK